MEGLSPYVRDQIAAGKAVLFLGAGASIPARGRNGTGGMSADALKEKLCDKFLGGDGKTKQLNYVASRCEAVAGLGPVHWFIKDLFYDLLPTRGHLAIPEFRWRGIVTTNYDLLVEKAYDQSTSPRQRPERIIWDRDNFDAAVRNPDSVPVLKLHGCLTRLNDQELPLVISGHDYFKFKANRAQLVSTLREWATSYPVIFCGYGLADENVRDILFDVSDKYLNRPQFVLVDPGLGQGDIDYWKSLRFDCLPLTFDSFMEGLQQEISCGELTLVSALSDEASSVTKLIPSKKRPSPGLSAYLGSELQHIHSGLLTELMPPQDFYRGISDGFAWISESFDVRRRVSDTLLEDAVLDSGRAALERPFLYVLKGYAGSGKSVSLKRFAWEAAVDYDAPVFYLGPGTVIRETEIVELVRLIEERIYVVVDDLLLNTQELRNLFQTCKKLRCKVTFVGGARTNEWNLGADGIGADIEAEYELLDLNRPEVELLVQRLEANRCLGYLEHLSKKERVDYFLDKLKSQLLVALHEATEGKSFEEIIGDEYSKVTPIEARLLYLDVCTLDRFDVGLRAGLMSRLSGVTFEDFSKRLLKPLEHVINVRFDHRLNDYIYRSRHQHIAGLVFDGALETPAERASQIVRILRYLNGAYETDRTALQRLVRGRTLAEEFSDKAHCAQIFEAAVESGMHSSVVDHQRAVFELHHPHGDLRSALSIIQRVEQNPGPLKGRTVAHTKGNILRRLANLGRTPLERERLRQEALVILNQLTKAPKESLPFLTRGQLLLEQLQERISQIDSSDVEGEADSRAIVEMTKEIESNLRQGLQAFPEDEKLLSFEAELSKFLNNTPRALKALERAYAANRQSVYTTIRLARQYALNPQTADAALTMLRKLTSEQPLSKEAHFELARLLMSDGESKNAREISQHLRRSFAPGDAHVDARFTYARHEYMFGNVDAARREFESLKRSGLSPDEMNHVRNEIRDSNGHPALYDATVASVHESFAFVKTGSFPDNIFMHFSAAPSPDVWENVKPNSRVRVSIGFSYKGPRVKRMYC